MNETRRDRCESANLLLRVIAAHGHGFFYHGGNVTRFEVGHTGLVWLIDGFSGKRVYAYGNGRWHGFTNGGTLRSFCESLHEFIREGTPVNHRWFERAFGSEPTGFLFGAAPESDTIKAKAAELRIINV